MMETGDFLEVHDFLEQAFELAFGDGALDKGYSRTEVIDRLKEMIQEGIE
jgi:hypothetical protein